MKTYEFIVTLAEGTEHTDELAEALYEAGCDDGSVWSSGGRVQIGFTRRAESLEPAIRSADLAGEPLAGWLEFQAGVLSISPSSGEDSKVGSGQ
jgi:hypothetical protein